MADWNDLRTGFEFDRWATTLWRECLDKKGAGDPDRAILGHILSAQKVWLTRCYGTSLDKMPEVDPTQEAIDSLNKGWLEALEQFRDDPIVAFRRTTGEAYQLPLSEIVLHVLNHGTYHRGELRGLCRSRDDNDFPETDRGRYMLLNS